MTSPRVGPYGSHHNEEVQEIGRSSIPDDIKLEPGMQLRALEPGNQPFLLTMVDIADTILTVDASHPLAGKDPTFGIEPAEIV